MQIRLDNKIALKSSAIRQGICGVTLLTFLAAQLAGHWPAFALRVQAGLESDSESGLRAALLQGTSAGLESVQEEFIEQVIKPISGPLPENVDISMTTDDPGGFPILTLRHQPSHKGQSLELSYRVEFTGSEIRVPEIPSLSVTNLIQIPHPGAHGLPM